MKPRIFFLKTGLAQSLLAIGGMALSASALAAAPTATEAKQSASTMTSASVAAPKPGAKPGAKATKTPATKDIALDQPNAAPDPAAAGGVLVPTPAGATPAATPRIQATPATAPGALQGQTGPAAPTARRYAAAAHDAATAGAMAELGLDLLRQQSAASGNAQRNAVVSPLSLVSALGMVHAGTAGAGARELAALLGTPTAGERIYHARLPLLLDRLAQPSEAGVPGVPFVMANRVWLDGSVLPAIPPAYAAAVAGRFGADAAVLSFAQPAAARKTINDWVSAKTARRIPALMPEGSVTPATQLVVTNAIHFKSKWSDPFDPAKTLPKPFHTQPGGAPKSVPTMVDERVVRVGTVDNITVLELPFAGDTFSLLLGMPPAGHTLNAFETDLEGLDIASWSAQLKPKVCRLELPKFRIAPASQPLKQALQALGVSTPFGPDADFSPMLGKAAKGVHLDNIFQSATIIVDEQGGEAAAATGAAVTAKSFSMPAPPCVVDRPFIFVVAHRASGAPLFVGKVADPTQH